MTGEHLRAQARRVVTGYDPSGRSCVSSDAATPHRLPLAGNTKCDIWRMASLPVSVDDGDGLILGELVTQPPYGGLVYRLVTFPPDDEWDRSQGYADSRGPLSTGNPDGDDEGIPGLHQTETVDVLTVLSGELVCITQTGEVVLGPGDSIVQRGTKHAWSNRGAGPVSAVSLMVSAVR